MRKFLTFPVNSTANGPDNEDFKTVRTDEERGLDQYLISPEPSREDLLYKQEHLEKIESSLKATKVLSR